MVKTLYAWLKLTMGKTPCLWIIIEDTNIVHDPLNSEVIWLPRRLIIFLWMHSSNLLFKIHTKTYCFVAFSIICIITFAIVIFSNSLSSGPLSLFLSKLSPNYLHNSLEQWNFMQGLENISQKVKLVFWLYSHANIG